jgi:hypothetical protein
MAFSELDLARIDKVVGEFCRKRVPPHMKSKIDFVYEVVGQTVVIYEKRPHWQEAGRVTRSHVAKFSYTRSSNIWRLYWMRGNGKLLLYEGGESRDLAVLMRMVDEDRHGCFFG